MKIDNSYLHVNTLLHGRWSYTLHVLETEIAEGRIKSTLL